MNENTLILVTNQSIRTSVLSALSTIDRYYAQNLSRRTRHESSNASEDFNITLCYCVYLHILYKTGSPSTPGVSVALADFTRYVLQWSKLPKSVTSLLV